MFDDWLIANQVYCLLPIITPRGRPFIRIGFDTPKLASAWIGGKMTDGELLYPQESQCIGADVSLGLCREISPGGDE
jgi:hypothetical protein